MIAYSTLMIFFSACRKLSFRVLLPLLVALPVFSQVKKQEELINQFEKFKSGAQQQHQSFIDRNDSLFLQFLQQSWKKVNLIRSELRSPLKPSLQPTLKDSLRSPFSREVEVDTNQVGTRNLLSLQHNLQMDDPVGYASVSYIKGLQFYGIESQLEVKPHLLPELRVISPKSIAEFYTGLTRNKDYWAEQLAVLQNMRSKYLLNDWGFYQLSSKAAHVFYESSNERKLLSWYILLRAGYKVKIGYNEELVYLLFPAKEKLYGTPYFKEDDDIFYVMEENRNVIQDLQTYNNNYPGNSKSVSFALSEYPLLQGDKFSKSHQYKGIDFEFTFNRGVLDFLSTYPQCDLRVYFGPGLTSSNEKKLDDFFQPKLKGLSKRESIDMLLDFCQHAFPYATDQSQFGKEKYLFSEQSLFFPANDCEDRTIFLSYLIKRYLKLETIALDFPGHVNLGVFLNESFTGTYIAYIGKKYLICDPTYINAKSGMLSSEYLSQKAKIIPLTQ